MNELSISEKKCQEKIDALKPNKSPGVDQMPRPDASLFHPKIECLYINSITNNLQFFCQDEKNTTAMKWR